MEVVHAEPFPHYVRPFQIENRPVFGVANRRAGHKHVLVVLAAGRIQINGYLSHF